MVTLMVDKELFGTVEALPCSTGEGVRFHVQVHGQRRASILSKPEQIVRKSTTAACALLAMVVDDRPAKDRLFMPAFEITDAKTWNKLFKDEEEAMEVQEHVQRHNQDGVRMFFQDVQHAIRSAMNADLREAIERVKKDAGLISRSLSEEEWMEIYKMATVESVHGR